MFILTCVSCTAFGSPVVPLENKMAATSSLGLMLRLDSAGREVLEGLAAKAANEIQPGWLPFVMIV